MPAGSVVVRDALHGAGEVHGEVKYQAGLRFGFQPAQVPKQAGQLGISPRPGEVVAQVLEEITVARPGRPALRAPLGVGVDQFLVQGNLVACETRGVVVHQVVERHAALRVIAGLRGFAIQAQLGRGAPVW